MIELLINLEINQIMISDIKSKDHNKFKLIYDFDKDYQTYLESQFVYWKFLALIKYSQIDLDHHGFSNEPGFMKNQDARRIDIINLLQIMSKQFLSHYEVKQKSKKKNTGRDKDHEYLEG